MTTTVQTGFIGAGNMASALIKGLISNGTSPTFIGVVDPDQQKLDTLKQECGIQTFESNQALAQNAEILVLAVKPQVMKIVLTELAPALKANICLLLSIAAGITIDNLIQWSHEEQAVVRCMPNTPALVREGASALFANTHCSEQQKSLATSTLEAVGAVTWLENESQMDAVTALSGSGPAYFFLLIEAMQEAGLKLGLNKEIVEALSLQTAYGAAKLALDGADEGLNVSELRKRVTSPGGTTEAALKQFESDNFKAIVETALSKAAQRSQELAQ